MPCELTVTVKPVAEYYPAITMASAASQSQQIAVTDLDLPQLSDVKRQLEEVNGNLF